MMNFGFDTHGKLQQQVPLFSSCTKNFFHNICIPCAHPLRPDLHCKCLSSHQVNYPKKKSH